MSDDLVADIEKWLDPNVLFTNDVRDLLRRCREKLDWFNKRCDWYANEQDTLREQLAQLQADLERLKNAARS